ncbi:VWA domain-containing protein, partial [bacterium]|nr:VWA domain-containing protein [bacterium]
MRFGKVVLFALIGLAGAVFAAGNGIEVSGVKFYHKGTPHYFQMTSPTEYELSVSCTEDTGAVDIVFVLDTTGSMSSSIDEAVAHIVEFAETMAATGYDYSFGIVTYGDGWNFPHGYDLTTSADTFVAWMGPIGSTGGGDIPEDALDAIQMAIDSIHWRPMALKVIILLTDACFCEPGAGCEDCHATYTSDEVATSLLDGGFMFFSVTRDPVWGGMCCDGTYSMWWYQNIADSTGGRWFSLSESFASIYHDIIGLLGTFQVIEVDVANFSGEDLDSLYAYITFGSCIELLYGANPAVRSPFADGDTVSFFWRVNYTSGCTGPEGCFQVSLSDDSGTFSRMISGCMYIPNCYCTPVVSGNISPEPGVWSACDPQPIQIGIYDDEGVDANTIVFELNDDEFTYPDPSMEFDDSAGVLTFVPDTGMFESGDTVNYGLVDAHDAAGCTLSTAASGWFLVDLDPPQFADENPPDGIIVGGIPTDISLHITDQYAGVDTSSIFLVIDGTDTFTLADSVLYYADSVLHFNPVGLYDWEAGETVEVCVYAADLVSETYCGPNADEFCWNFVIDRLHIFFVDTTTYPDSEIVYPLFAEDPARFGFTNYWVDVRYNPAVVTVEDVVPTGTASDGFTVSWDTSGGVLHIEAASSSPVGIGTHLIDLNLRINSGLSGGSFTPMRVVDAQFDSGRVGWFADDGIILVEWTQIQWVHDLEFWGYDGEGGYLIPTSLTIGCAYSGTEGFDPEYDIIIPTPPPSQTEAFI